MTRGQGRDTPAGTPAVGLPYDLAVRLLQTIRDAEISDRQLHDRALRAAKRACLRCAEGQGKRVGLERARSFQGARSEALDAITALQAAALRGAARNDVVAAAVMLQRELAITLQQLLA